MLILKKVNTKVDKKLRLNSSGAFLLVCLFMTTLVGNLFESLAVAEPSVSIKPVLTAGGRWESNFFLTEEDEQALYTYLVSPGVTVEMQGARTNIALNYNLEAYYYEEADDASRETENGQRVMDELDYIGHMASLSSSYDVTSRLTLGLDGAYSHTRYPTYYDRLSTSIWHREYDLYQITPVIYYDITPQLTTGLSYRYAELDMGSEDDFNPYLLDADNTEENTWALNINWTPQASIGVDLDLTLGELDYVERLDDYENQKIQLSIQKRFRTIALDGSVGYDKRDYKVAELEDQDLVTWRLALTAQEPEVTGRQRSLGKSFVRPIDHLYFAVERDFNTIGDLFTATRFVGSVGYRFGEKLESRIKGWYQISDYDFLTDQTIGNRVERELNTWDISASLGFKIIRNLVLAVTVGHREQESNIDDFDNYTNTYGLIGLSYNFDFWRRGGFTNEALYY